MKKGRVYITETPLIKEWDFEKNVKWDPSKLSANSHEKVYWRCSKGHSWDAIVKNRYRLGRGCRICSNKEASMESCLFTIFPGIAKTWHPTKNGNLTSKDVTYGSGKVVWWQCETGKEDHEWEESVDLRVRRNFCPCCINRKVCNDNCLANTYSNIAKQWHPTRNETLTPNDFVFGSNKKVWWLCKNGHSWEAEIVKRVLGNSCPECKNKKVGLDNSLLSVNPSLALEFDVLNNKGLLPEMVISSSHKPVWWKCSKCGHLWKTAIRNRSRNKNPSGCPICSKGPISKVSQEWLDSLNIPQECREYYFKDLNYKVDAFVPETSTVYEFFGDYWHGNPEVYDRTQEHPVCGKTFGELYEETKTRINRLVNAGYFLVYVWEKDYLKSINSK